MTMHGALLCVPFNKFSSLYCVFFFRLSLSLSLFSTLYIVCALKFKKLEMLCVKKRALLCLSLHSPQMFLVVFLRKITREKEGAASEVESFYYGGRDRRIRMGKVCVLEKEGRGKNAIQCSFNWNFLLQLRNVAALMFVF